MGKVFNLPFRELMSSFLDNSRSEIDYPLKILHTAGIGQSCGKWVAILIIPHVNWYPISVFFTFGPHNTADASIIFKYAPGANNGFRNTIYPTCA